MGLPPPRPLRKKRSLVPPPTSERIFPKSLRPCGYLLPGQLDVPMGPPPPRPLRKKRSLVPPPTSERIFPKSLRPCGYLLPGQLDVPTGLPPPRPSGKRTLVGTSSRRRAFFFVCANPHHCPHPTQAPPDPGPTRHPGEDEQSRVAFEAPRSKTNGAPAQSRKPRTSGQEVVKTSTEVRD